MEALEYIHITGCINFILLRTGRLSSGTAYWKQWHSEESHATNRTYFEHIFFLL